LEYTKKYLYLCVMNIQPIYDCHNKTYTDVEDKLPNWLLLRQDCLPIHIVTGNSEKMKEIVTKILIDYDFKYMVPPHNYGMIIVL